MSGPKFFLENYLREDQEKQENAIDSSEHLFGALLAKIERFELEAKEKLKKIIDEKRRLAKNNVEIVEVEVFVEEAEEKLFEKVKEVDKRKQLIEERYRKALLDLKSVQKEVLLTDTDITRIKDSAKRDLDEEIKKLGKLMEEILLLKFLN